MKAIKIVESNKGKIEDLLASVNGKAYQHAYTEYSEIEQIAKRAEAKVLGLMPKSLAPGARFISESGLAVAKSYRNSRRATLVRIERRTAGWYLIEAISTEVWERGGGPDILCLTEEQAVSYRRAGRIRRQTVPLSVPHESAGEQLR